MMKDLTPDQHAALQALIANHGVQRLFAVYAEQGGALRIVGGAVRDALLGLPVGEIDLASDIVPEQGMAWLQAAGIIVKPTGIKHGTITAIINRTPYEITTLRRDIATDGRHATVQFGTAWADDARRRDFTINGLFCDAHGMVTDDVGGLADLRAGRVRFIGDAEQRCREDYLRILRLFRFWARFGCEPIDQATLHAVARCVDGLPQLSAQRVWSEIKKLLVTERVGEAMTIMQRNGILSVILRDQFHDTPQLAALADVEEVLAELPTETMALRRLAILCAYRTQNGWTLDAQALRTIFALSNAETDHLRDLNTMGHNILWWTDRLMSALASFDRTAVIDACLISVALNHEQLPALQAVWPDLLSVTPPVFPVTASDLMAKGYQPGPELGVALSKLRDDWLESNCTLMKDALLSEM